MSVTDSRTAAWPVFISRILCQFLPFFSVCTTLFILYFVLRYGAYGFDFTDEGFYLNWIVDPSLYKIHIPISFFGFVYHPIYVVLNGDVASLRQVNVLLIFGAASFLSFLAICRHWPQHSTRKSVAAIIAAGLATTSLTYFSVWWLVTPSYNSLTFQGMLLSFIGVTIAAKDRGARSALGWAMIGIGGLLVFLAKPSTAALLAPSVLLYLLASGRRAVIMIGFTILLTACLLLLFVYSVDGSIAAFVDRFRISIEMLQLLGSGQEFGKIFRFDSIGLTLRERAVMTAVVVAIGAGAFLVRRLDLSRGLFAALGSVLAIASIGYLFCLDAPLLGVRGIVFLAVPIAAAILGLYVSIWRGAFELIRPVLPLAALLLVAPYLYSFGTNGNYWTDGSAAAFFWVLSGVLVLGSLFRSRLDVTAVLALVVVLQCLSCGLLVQSIHAPYRQESLTSGSKARWNLRDHGDVMMSSAFRDYLAAARDTAQQAGFKSGDPVIDLTGRSPGLLYDLGARSAGQPWLVGAYPGSLAVAVATLRSESCATLAHAWLLIEPNGPRSLDGNQVVQSFGAALDSDYRNQGSFRTAPQAGGYLERYDQQLLSPTRPVAAAIEACESERQTIR